MNESLSRERRCSGSKGQHGALISLVYAHINTHTHTHTRYESPWSSENMGKAEPKPMRTYTWVGWKPINTLLGGSSDTVTEIT